MINESHEFLNKSRHIAVDENHRLKILKAISTYEHKVDEMKPQQFRDWQEARRIAAEVKNNVLERLPYLLEEFETKIKTRGASVLWAENAKEAGNHFLSIVKRHAAKKIVKAKSMTTEEIEFNQLCEKNNLEVIESDLGEWIVQLAGEKPYHIVTPAMHKSRQEIGQLFQEHLGTEKVNSAEELAMIAREHLRKIYVTSDIGVTGANFIIAEEGALALTENEGNARLTMSCTPIHVVFVGIEKVLPRLADLALFWPLLSTSATGQQITGYNSIILGPKQPAEVDGPEHLYVILLDNGRSELYRKPELQSILRCIRCGACLNACPVYRTIGGHTYHTTYQGPIGSVITPQLLGLNQWGHLSFASSLCAACSSVCPVDIDIHQLLLENRWKSFQSGQTGLLWNNALRLWAWLMSRRSRLNFSVRLARPLLRSLKLLMNKNLKRRVPHLPQKTFAELWEENEQ